MSTPPTVFHLVFFSGGGGGVPDVRAYFTAAVKEKEEDNLPAILPLVILCLQTGLGEKEDSLFVIVDVSARFKLLQLPCPI